MSLEYAEADTFFCFATLMGEISDNFNQVLDHSEYGIGECAVLCSKKDYSVVDDVAGGCLMHYRGWCVCMYLSVINIPY